MTQGEPGQRELRKQIEKKLVESVENREIFQLRPFTMVRLYIRVDGNLVEVFNFTKVRYPDKWDAEIGVRRAEEKAIAALAKSLLSEEQEWIRSLDTS